MQGMHPRHYQTHNSNALYSVHLDKGRPAVLMFMTARFDRGHAVEQYGCIEHPEEPWDIATQSYAPHEKYVTATAGCK